jgi:amidohydrolase
MIASELHREIDLLLPRLREIRHDIHKHPELGFEEVRTSQIVREFLEEHGYAPRACAETGLVADLKPDATGGTTTIGLRADMDCLPIQENTDLPYKSIHTGKGHKCGHDGHTTILLGVAAILAKQKQTIPGNVRLLFQPAEEGARGGGAKVMVAEGALKGVREVYGLHNWPGWPKGQVRVKHGAMLAQVHTFYLRIHGVGGHGSQPQLCRDPILAGAQVVNALQSVVARGLGYQGGAVVSVCQFVSGTTHNIIPADALLVGTIRTFHPDVEKRVLERFHEVCNGVAAAFGVKIELELEVGYPVTMNHPECADAVTRVARGLFGDANVSTEELPMAGGEDFAYFAQEIPGAYFFVGAKRGNENTPVCHHPDFDFEDDLIPVGMKMFLGILADRFAKL